ETLIANLDSEVFSTREAAEKELAPIAFDLLPLLDPALGSASAEVRNRVGRIVWKSIKPLVCKEIRHGGYEVWYEAAPWFALFGEPTWKLIEERLQGPDGDAEVGSERV